MPRLEFSRTTKLAAYDRCGGTCEGCGCDLALAKGVEYDHRIADNLRPDNSVENCQVLCIPCHKQKTKADVKVIAKANSVRAGRLNAKPFPSRPLPGSRGSGLRKKFDGTVLRIEE